MGQDRLLLHREEGLDFPQWLHQILQRGPAVVPLTCGGRGTTVLPVTNGDKAKKICQIRKEDTKEITSETSYFLFFVLITVP